ncbi:hypothetical protein FA95DRAFT_1613711 [Auriscalpium vulgare]|uniref:Uncharacterized protein n=1 Tax=Auriscalpium vulgare TaxID=40419 RepID=A0ACB8R261_9AGAM|nr:hypothetical protein FA95DRAFT_1613711 [Auriscalpium vulgare]
MLAKHACPIPLSASLDVSTLPISDTGFIGKPGVDPTAALYLGKAVSLRTVLEDLQFQLVPWDGSTSHAILDSKDRIIVPMPGCPDGDASWPDVACAADAELEDVLETCIFTRKQLRSRRGCYPSLSMGYSFGGGQMEPKNISPKNSSQEKAQVRLRAHEPLRRIAGFGSSTFYTSSPFKWTLYDDVLKDIRADNPGLTPPYPNSVFPAATFNFGPRIATAPHRDYYNVPFGWCSITALGRYNPKLGGHLILWDLKLVIEFPPGSTILIPSALLTHSNVAIRQGETRRSFTQYCAGGLMRWHAYGRRTAASLRRADPGLKAELDASVEQRVADALGRFRVWEPPSNKGEGTK